MSEDDIEVEEAAGAEEGHATGRKKKVKIAAPKNIDYKGFGRTLNDYLNDRGETARHLAGQLGHALHTDAGLDGFQMESTLESMAGGYKTSAEAVAVVARELKLDIPISTAPPVRKSPFDQAARRRGGPARAGGSGEEE